MVHVAATGKDLEMSGYPAKVADLVFNRDGRWLATSGGAAAAMWDCSGRGPRGRTPEMLRGFNDVVDALAAQPSGELLAAGGACGTLVVARFGEPRSVALRARLSAGVGARSWSPDGRRLAVGTAEGEVLLFDTPTEARPRGGRDVP